MTKCSQKFRRALALVLAFVMVVSVLTVAPTTTVEAASKKVVKKMTGVPTTKTVEVNKSVTVKAKVTATKKVAKGDLQVSVKSSNKSVATVKVSKKASKKAKSGTNTIKITGKKAGTATITVATKATNKKNKKIKKKIKVTVKAATPTTTEDKNSVAVQSVAFDKTAYTVERGKIVQAKVTITPANATDKTITYASSDESIATISNAGVIYGFKAGTTTITATSKNGKVAKATVTVVEASSIELSATSLVIGKNQSANITANVNGVTWSSSDEKIATVDAVGKVTGIAPGVAYIIATNGKASAQCKVTVTKLDPEKVAVTLSVFNPIKNNDGSVIENTVLVNQDMVVQAYVEQNATPLANKRVTLKLDEIDQYNISGYDFTIKVDGTEKDTAVTNENGVAEFVVTYDYTVPSTYDNIDHCPYISFSASTTVDNVPNEEDITLKFGSVLRKGIEVDNNRYDEYDDIKPFVGHASGDDGIETTYNTNDYYADEYVSSQQVGNPVYLSAEPYFVLPPSRTASEEKFRVDFPSKTVTTGQKDTKVEGPGSTNTYTIYDDENDISTTTSVIDVPAGLASMSVMFNKISISKYSQLYVDLYEYDDVLGKGKHVFSKTYTEENNTLAAKGDGCQIDNLDEKMKGKGILIVSIQSPGQVDVSATGYSLDYVTGDFATNLTTLPEMIEVVDAVKWTDVTTSARYSVAETLTYDQVANSTNGLLKEYVGSENNYIEDNSNYTFAYRLPAFNSNATTANAITGNALITSTYKGADGTIKIATFAYPVVSAADGSGKPLNKNVLKEKTPDTKAIFLGYDVIDKDGNIQQTTGGIKINTVNPITEGRNQAVVTSTANNKSGAIFVEAKIKIDALDKELATANKNANYDKSPLLGADSKYPMYSYVQFVAKPDEEPEPDTVPVFHAIEDQYIVITGKVTASNAEQQAGQAVEFSYGNTKITPSLVGKTIGNDVTVVALDTTTNNAGEAYLILRGHEGASVQNVKVTYEGKFTTFRTYAGNQEFKTIKVNDEDVNICNLYWIDLGLAYEKDVATQDWMYNYTSAKTSETNSDSVVGKTWKVGFLPVADNSIGEDEYKFVVDFKKLRDALNDPDKQPENLFVSMKNAGVDYVFAGDNTKGCDASKDTIGDGSKRDVAVITSEQIGDTKVNGSLRLDSDSVVITYYDNLGELKTITTVGVNATAKNDKTYSENIDLGGKISYTMNWTAGNWASEFTMPYGTKVVAGQNFTVYFRLHDNKNNPVKDQDAVVTVIKNGVAETTTISATTNENGIIAISLPGQSACELKLKVAIDKYEQVSGPINVVAKASGVKALAFDGDPIFSSSDNKSVTVKFNNEVVNDALTKDMMKKLYIVKDKNGNVLEIADVTMSFDRVKITLSKDTFIEGEQYSVEVATGTQCTIDGITYVLYDAYGQAMPSGNTKTFTVRY